MTGKVNLEIQALRGIAILAVMIHHLPALFLWDTKRWDIVGRGLWVGVDLFFCISGYVIARTLLPSLHNKTGTPYWKEAGAFWVRRIYRITPTVWLWMFIVMLLGPTLYFLGTSGFSHQNIAEAAAVALHVENIHTYECVQQSNTCGDFGLFWTLSLEEQFYLAIPILVFVLRRHLTTFLIIAAAAQIFLNRTSWSSLLTVTRTDAIIIGVLLAIFAQSKTYKALDPKLNDSRWRLAIPPILLACLFITTKYEIVSFATGLAALISGLIVWLSSYSAGYVFRPSPLRWVLVWIGERSFAIYVIHVFAYWWTRSIWESLLPSGETLNGTYFLRFSVTAITMTFLLAHINYRFVEEPLRKKGKARAEAIIARPD